jgi:hypothetical protein
LFKNAILFGTKQILSYLQHFVWWLWAVTGYLNLGEVDTGLALNAL